MTGDASSERRRRIRRSSVVLALVAAAIYVGFIVSGVIRAQH